MIKELFTPRPPRLRGEFSPDRCNQHGHAGKFARTAKTFKHSNAKITKVFPAYLAFFGVAFVLFTLRPGSTYALDNLRVATASMTSPSVLYLLMAQKEGYFKNEGLNVEIINMRGEIAAKIAVAGEIDFFTQALSGLTAAVRGLPLKILMIVDEKPAWDFMAQPQIKSFAQLKGGTVGILSLEGSVALATREMLRKNNLAPTKDVQLLVMGGNDMRFMSLKGKAIQATLLDSANSYRAQKEGFNKLASASDYLAHYLNGGICAPQEKLRQAPERIARFMTASLKGYLFFTTRREASINYMMGFLQTKDRDAIAAIYDSSVRAVSRDETADEKALEGVIEDVKKSTGVKKEFHPGDFFDFSFLRKAQEKLKAGGWRP